MSFLVFIKRNPLLIIGLFMLFILLLLTFFVEHLPFIDQKLKEVKYIWNKNNIPVAPPFAPSERYIFGSDRLGRDMLSLIVIGAKTTLLMVLMITAIRYILAILLAYLAHKKTMGAQNLLNLLNGTFSYIPTIIMIILLATLPPILTIDTRPFFLVIIIATVELGQAASMIKHELDDLSTKEFINGGIAIGASPFRMLKSYYLPFLYEKLLVNIVSDLGKVMFLIGQLGFIGIFLSQELVQIDPGKFEIMNKSITWPSFFMDSFRDIRSAIWIPFYPALAITYSIITFNILAQGLQKLFQRNVSYF